MPSTCTAASFCDGYCGFHLTTSMVGTTTPRRGGGGRGRLDSDANADANTSSDADEEVEAREGGDLGKE